MKTNKFVKYALPFLAVAAINAPLAAQDKRDTGYQNKESALEEIVESGKASSEKDMSSKFKDYERRINDLKMIYKADKVMKEGSLFCCINYAESKDSTLIEAERIESAIEELKRVVEKYKVKSTGSSDYWKHEDGIKALKSALAELGVPGADKISNKYDDDTEKTVSIFRKRVENEYKPHVYGIPTEATNMIIDGLYQNIMCVFLKETLRKLKGGE